MEESTLTKKEISYKKRTVYLTVLILFMALAASALVVFGIIGIQVSKSVQTAAYDTKSEIQYSLSFIDDPLYNKNNMEFGEGFISKFVNNIDLAFLYSLDSNSATDISGNYTATALLEAIYNDKDLIWKKEFQLVPSTEFKSGQATKSISLPLSEYINFAKTIQQNTGVTTYVKMTITYSVNASAVIDGKPISEASESTLIVPITGDVIVMGGTPVSEQSKTVESEVLQELLPKEPTLICSIILLVLLACALLCLLILTKGVKSDPIQRELNNIFKKYNSRIIELHQNNHLLKRETVCVKSFRDLLLIADEMKKPILKNHSEDYLNTEFYVFDENKTFLFNTGFLDELADKKDGKALGDIELTLQD
jgi:archaellum component FlaG (FlaF/FlaG flagellin family)